MPRKLAEIRVYVPRKNRIVYVFNTKGEKVDSGPSKEMDTKYGLGGSIRLYISSGRLKDKQYYFSLSETFKIKESKWTSNPLLREKIEQEKETKRTQKLNHKRKL